MSETTHEQELLLCWRDYFVLLHAGACEGERKTEQDEELADWLSVFIAELESDVLHRDSGQPEFTRWDAPTDITEVDENRRV
jgi:hypothetical protein